MPPVGYRGDTPPTCGWPERPQSAWHRSTRWEEFTNSSKRPADG